VALLQMKEQQLLGKLGHQTQLLLLLLLLVLDR
jgi:hypothetical protein